VRASNHSPDEDTTDLEFARAVDHMGCTLDDVRVVVPGRVVTDGDDI
jgi:hypothetical protein